MDYLRLSISIFILEGALSILSAASLHKPDNFLFEDDHTAVFVDILKYEAQISVSVDSRQAVVDARIEFLTESEGFPILDLVRDPGAIQLDGVDLETREIFSPQNTTRLRIFSAAVPAGKHEARFHYLLRNGFKMTDEGAHIGFWMDDLGDRGFLEQYIPSNLEYDTFPLTLLLKMDRPLRDYAFFTNGRKKSINENTVLVQFPSFYNTASFFFHLLPAVSIISETSEFKNSAEQTIPVTVYGKKNLKDLHRYTERALATLQELEKDYGTFPHERLIVYAAPDFGGGMEHAGGTITSLSALSHEITHSYFGRAMMPANGNAGWIDEAIASWRDHGYPALHELEFSQANLAGFSQYRRSTEDAAYTKGRDFLSYLNARVIDSSSNLTLKDFLRNFLRQYFFDPILTEDFEKNFETFMGQSFHEDFSRYVFGRDREGEVNDEVRSWRPSRERRLTNPFHPKKTREELDAYL